jgi:tRNA threonylcarbamoyladenosine biosynthesis protein TsaB
MIVLGFDTATSATAVALRLGEGKLLDARDDPQEGEHPGHATRLLAMAGRLLATAGVAWGDLGRIAVGLGPGTFTGLRVGVATARGLAQSLSIELVGVSSLQALAQAAFNAPTNVRPRSLPVVLSVIDARRGEVFAGAYRTDRQGSVAELTELISPRALAPEGLPGLVALAEEQHAEGWRSGNQSTEEQSIEEQSFEEQSAEEPRTGDGGPWLAVGDGAVRYREHLEAAGVTVPVKSSKLHLVDAAAICELGLRGRPVRGLEQLLPDYRRRPDAEIAMETLASQESTAP